MYSTKILNKVPSRCLAFGNHENNPKHVVIVVPGNPGVVEYYRDFMSEIHRLIRQEYPDEDIPVVGISHGGHQIDETDGELFPSVDAHPKLYDLEGQTKGKMEFVNSMGKDTNIILIGHSIGCKMLLDLLKSLPQNVQSRVVKCYMLFPTIERMKETPNGRRLWPLLPYADIAYYILWPLRILPVPVQRLLLTIYFFFRPNSSSCCLTASLQLFHGDVYRRITTLVRAELSTVLELDVEALEMYGKKNFCYFGVLDGWCPLEYAHGMKDRLPNLDYEVCSRGIEHAFVLQSSKEMASILTPKILEDIQRSGTI